MTRRAAFNRAGATCVPLYEPIYGVRYLEVADAAAAKAVLNDRKMYTKDLAMVCRRGGGYTFFFTLTSVCSTDMSCSSVKT